MDIAIKNASATVDSDQQEVSKASMVATFDYTEEENEYNIVLPVGIDDRYITYTFDKDFFDLVIKKINSCPIK